MKQNQDYKNEALSALRGNWAPAVVVYIIIMLIACIGSSPSTVGTVLGAESQAATMGLQIPAFILAIFLSGPLSIGVANAFNALLVHGDNNLIGNSFSLGFARNYLHHVWGYLLMNIYTFLWTLLFIIPGIIKYFSYAMTPFILVDRPELSAGQAIDLSMAMMKGRRFDLFYLYLSFIGWAILCLFTFGIGYLWLQPYIQTSVAAFYQDVKADYEMRQNAA